MAQLNQAYANQYGANVYRMAQQLGSVLRKFVRVEPQKGEFRYFDRVHPTEAIRVDSKYMDTPMISTEFSRRAVFAEEYIWSDMIDWQDDLNMLIDPKSSITEAGAFALGRIIDKVIINNIFSGAAREGKSGGTIVDFPNAQKLPITLGGGGSNTGLSIEKIMEARSMFGKANIDLSAPGNEAILVISQAQLDDLAKGTNVDVRNSLYQSVNDLLTGKTDKFLGFTIVRTELLNTTAIDDTHVSRCCCAFVKSGSILTLPKDITMKISERDDKCANWQALAKLKVGGTRIEDEKFVQIPCLEAI